MASDLGSRWIFKELMDVDDSVRQRTDYDLYMKALLICANGDNRLSEQERSWVVGYCAALGGSPQLVEELKTFAPRGDYKQIIDGSASAVHSVRAFIYDAIRACSADGEYHERERKLIHNAAATLGLSEEAVYQLELLYKEEWSLRQKRHNLIWPTTSRDRRAS